MKWAQDQTGRSHDVRHHSFVGGCRPWKWPSIGHGTPESQGSGLTPKSSSSIIRSFLLLLWGAEGRAR